LRLDRIRQVSARVAEMSARTLEQWKPVTGETLFQREAAAVATQFHEPAAVEPYSCELVGATRHVVLGKKSGIESIRIKAHDLGLELGEGREQELLSEVKALSARKGGLVTDDEFRNLVGRS
jgi:isopropylmalate/homocitrate/citramalate synthase